MRKKSRNTQFNVYSGAMDRRVERKYIDRWIVDNRPDGLLRLAERTGVSSSTIVSARNGRLPRKLVTLDKIAEGLGLSTDTLFPPAEAEPEGGEAS